MKKYLFLTIISAVLFVGVFCLYFYNKDRLTSRVDLVASDDVLEREICSQVSPGSKYFNDIDIQKTDGVCRVVRVSEPFAIGGDSSGAGGGVAWMAVKSGGIWSKINFTQDAWECEIMKEYNVPKSFFRSCYYYKLKKPQDF